MVSISETGPPSPSRKQIERSRCFERTLSSNASVPSYTDRLAHPVGARQLQLLSLGPVVLLLPLVLEGIVATSYQGRHNDPFRDRRAMDPTRRRDSDVAVFHNRVACPVIHAGREQMDQFETCIRRSATIQSPH